MHERQGETSIDESLEIVRAELGQFLHPAVIDDWLSTVQPELGCTPVQALLDGRDIEDVLQTVNATRYGAHR